MPSPGNLPNPGIEPRSPALQAGSLPAEPQGKPKNNAMGSLSFLQVSQFRHHRISLIAQLVQISACNAGDPGLIPGLGRSPGERIGCPLRYSWASPVAQLVKIPPATWETWVRSLGWEDPLEKGKATHSSTLA